MSFVSRPSERSPRSRPAQRVPAECPLSLYEKGRLQINFDAYEVRADGRPIHLKLREFQLLRFFVLSANRVVDRAQILAHLWQGARIDPKTVDVHIYRLRKRIERDSTHPELLVTVHGVGWRFDERPLLKTHGTADSDRGRSHDRSQNHS